MTKKKWFVSYVRVQPHNHPTYPHENRIIDIHPFLFVERMGFDSDEFDMDERKGPFHKGEPIWLISWQELTEADKRVWAKMEPDPETEWIF